MRISNHLLRISLSDQIMQRIMHEKNNRILVILFSAMVLFSIIPVSALATENVRVAITPFAIHSKEDISFLQEGIYDIFSFRLSRLENVEVISRKNTEEEIQKAGDRFDEAMYKEIADHLNADGIIFGSITVFGNTVSLGARYLDNSGGANDLSLTEELKETARVIPVLGEFADEISKHLTKRTGAESSVASGETVPSPPEYKPAPENKGQFPREPSVRKTEKAPVVRSPDIQSLVNGIAITDIDGDGKNEILTASKDGLTAFRFENGKFVRVAALDTGASYNLISLDAKDLDKDGVPEIFCASLSHDNKSISTLRLAPKGKTFTILEKYPSRVYRILTPPGGEPCLYAQKQVRSTPFKGEIYQVNPLSETFTTIETVVRRNRAHVFGLARGDVTHSAMKHYVVFNREEEISIIKDGEILFSTKDAYGGSSHYIIKETEDPASPERTYLSLRLVVADTDDDGKEEILTIQNNDLSGRMLERFRQYTKTRILSLVWNGAGFYENWKTSEFNGHFRDFAWGDADNDGKPEIAGALVVSEKMFMGSGAKSAVLVIETEEIE